MFSKDHDEFVRRHHRNEMNDANEHVYDDVEDQLVSIEQLMKTNIFTMIFQQRITLFYLQFDLMEISLKKRKEKKNFDQREKQKLFDDQLTIILFIIGKIHIRRTIIRWCVA